MFDVEYPCAMRGGIWRWDSSWRTYAEAYYRALQVRAARGRARIVYPDGRVLMVG